jgi:hypothetical protein
MPWTMPADQVVEAAGGGTDLVKSNIGLHRSRLWPYVENVTLTRTFRSSMVTGKTPLTTGLVPPYDRVIPAGRRCR